MEKINREAEVAVKLTEEEMLAIEAISPVSDELIADSIRRLRLAFPNLRETAPAYVVIDCQYLALRQRREECEALRQAHNYALESRAREQKELIEFAEKLERECEALRAENEKLKAENKVLEDGLDEVRGEMIVMESRFDDISK